MSDITTVEPERLAALITRAAAALARATTAAEILDATNQAKIVYEAAKAAARLAKAKEAHDEIVAACRKAMADALVIEAQAQCRLADEYDAAQERGEVKTPGQPHKKRIIPNENNSSTVTDIGLTSKQIHEARIVRDAEKKKPGLVKQTIEAKLKAGSEPLRADVRRAAKEAIAPPPPPPRPAPPSPPRPAAPPPPSPEPKPRAETEDESGVRESWLKYEQALRTLTSEQLIARILFFEELAHYHRVRAERFKAMLIGVFDEERLDQEEADRLADIAARVDARYDKVEWRPGDDIELKIDVWWWRGEDDDDGDE
jgi:hypothetical protein